MSSDQIKARSRAQLGGGLFTGAWMMALLAALVYSMLLGAAGSFFAPLTLLLLGPLDFGLAAIFLRQYRYGGSADLGQLFSGFSSDFTHIFLLGLIQRLIVTLWSLLLVIPGIIKNYAYSMAYYLKADHPDWGWRECLEVSEEMMRGHKMDLFLLDLSFIGWYILGSLALGIGTLWVIPYHMTTRAGFYDCIRTVPY